MITLKSGITKGSFLFAAGALSSGLAMGQATIFVKNNYLLQSLSVIEEVPPTSGSSNTGLAAGNTPQNPNNNASANMANHSFSVNGAAQLLSLSNPNNFTGLGPTVAEAGYATADLTDTVTFHTSGLVTFGLTPFQLINTVAGNMGSGSILQLIVSSPTISEGDVEEQAVNGGPQQEWNAATQSLQTIPGAYSASTTTSGVNGADYQITNGLDNAEMTISFVAQAGVKYTFASYASATTAFDNNEGQASPGLALGYEAPWSTTSSWGGVAKIDPMWTLTTSPGQTFTTGSGGLISLATPEPSPVAAIGIACAGLLIRRRRKA